VPLYTIFQASTGLLQLCAYGLDSSPFAPDYYHISNSNRIFNVIAFAIPHIIAAFETTEPIRPLIYGFYLPVLAWMLSHQLIYVWVPYLTGIFRTDFNDIEYRFRNSFKILPKLWHSNIPTLEQTLFIILLSITTVLSYDHVTGIKNLRTLSPLFHRTFICLLTLNVYFLYNEGKIVLERSYYRCTVLVKSKLVTPPVLLLPFLNIVLFSVTILFFAVSLDL
jgi:hypothetical protein